jgi:hypothetical protein
MPAPFQGGCRCGAIRYECSADPFMAAHCHCRDCQYASGTAFSTVVIVPAAGVQVTKGELQAYRVEAESGNSVTREFCPTCGSPVFSKLDSNPAIQVIKAGTLDDPSWVQPAMNIWTDSAQPWAPLEEGLPRIPKNPQG